MTLIRLSNGQTHNICDQDVMKLRRSRKQFQIIGKSDMCFSYRCDECKFGKVGCKCYCHTIYKRL